MGVVRHSLEARPILRVPMCSRGPTLFGRGPALTIGCGGASGTPRQPLRFLSSPKALCDGVRSQFAHDLLRVVPLDSAFRPFVAPRWTEACGRGGGQHRVVSESRSPSTLPPPLPSLCESVFDIARKLPCVAQSRVGPTDNGFGRSGCRHLWRTAPRRRSGPRDRMLFGPTCDVCAVAPSCARFL